MIADPSFVARSTVQFPRDVLHRAMFTLPGPPRTKKTSSRIMTFGKKKVVQPSEAWLKWRDHVREYCATKPEFALGVAVPCNCQATFYRDKDVGDATGYYQGLGDVLQECGIVANDKWLVSWDGSRLRKDKDRPRVEVVLTWAVPR